MFKFKSFKMVLIRNFSGTLLLVLLAVYALFNTITSTFISNEAALEFSRSLDYIDTIEPQGQTLRFSAEVGSRRLHSLDSFLFQWEQLQSIRQLMMNTEGILIGSGGEISFPDLDELDPLISSEIMYLRNYFVGHPSLFANGQMRRVSTEHFAYYVLPLDFPIAEGVSFTFLLYTDITSMIRFVQNINYTLGILLFVSAVASLIISILISSKVQSAILRLCTYAEAIGHGTFEKNTDDFAYTEFNTLSKSMNKMSRRLRKYESNQKLFFQNISHELRTPLMSIKGYTEGILADVLDKEEACSIILEESERMEELVSQLLYIARMDSQSPELNLSSINLNIFLSDAYQKLQIFASRFDTTLSLSLPATSIFVTSDKSLLQVAVDNVITNCIRHAHSHVSLSLNLIKNQVSLTISDDGDGITPDDFPHIFDRFYKGAHGSTGLGLSITKDTLAQLGGEILAFNTENGARFVILLNV